MAEGTHDDGPQNPEEEYFSTTLLHAMMREYAYADALAFISGERSCPWTDEESDAKNTRLYKGLFEDDVHGLVFLEARKESQKAGFTKGQIVLAREPRSPAFEIFWIGERVAATYPYDTLKQERIIPNLEEDEQARCWTFLLEDLTSFDIFLRYAQDVLADMEKFCGNLDPDTPFLKAIRLLLDRK